MYGAVILASLLGIVVFWPFGILATSPSAAGTRTPATATEPTHIHSHQHSKGEYLMRKRGAPWLVMPVAGACCWPRPAGATTTSSGATTTAPPAAATTTRWSATTAAA